MVHQRVVFRIVSGRVVLWTQVELAACIGKAQAVNWEERDRIIARYRLWYKLAREETEGATYHVPILEAMPLIEELLKGEDLV